MCDLSGCDLQLAVFLLLSLFWTKHHSTTKSPPPTTPPNNFTRPPLPSPPQTQPRKHRLARHSPTTPKQRPSIAADFSPPSPSSSRPTSAQNRGGLLTACAFLYGRIATFPRNSDQGRFTPPFPPSNGRAWLCPRGHFDPKITIPAPPSVYKGTFFFLGVLCECLWVAPVCK